MAPKTNQTRDDILASAVALVKDKGLETLNARSLAAEMGISTTPVLQAFRTMENLKLEVKKSLLEELERGRRKLLVRYASRPWLARLGAYVLMAWNFPPAYRVLRDWFWSGDFPESWNTLLEDVGRDPALGGASGDVLAQKAFRMNVYAAGFAEMAARGLLYKPTEEGLLTDLEQALLLLLKGGNHDFITLA